MPGSRDHSSPLRELGGAIPTVFEGPEPYSSVLSRQALDMKRKPEPSLVENRGQDLGHNFQSKSGNSWLNSAILASVLWLFGCPTPQGRSHDIGLNICIYDFLMDPSQTAPRLRHHLAFLDMLSRQSRPLPAFAPPGTETVPSPRRSSSTLHYQMPRLEPQKLATLRAKPLCAGHIPPSGKDGCP